MRSLALSLVPFVLFLACGGGKPAETGGAGTSAEGPTPVPTAAATPTAAPSTSADDGDDEDDTIPTADVVCKHLGDVLKGKAPALATCVAEFEKKQLDDLNGYVCQATCVMSANAADAVEACKAKCKK